MPDVHPTCCKRLCRLAQLCWRSRTYGSLGLKTELHRPSFAPGPDGMPSSEPRGESIGGWVWPSSRESARPSKGSGTVREWGLCRPRRIAPEAGAELNNGCVLPRLDEETVEAGVEALGKLKGFFVCPCELPGASWGETELPLVETREVLLHPTENTEQNVKTADDVCEEGTGCDVLRWGTQVKNKDFVSSRDGPEIQTHLRNRNETVWEVQGNRRIAVSMSFVQHDSIAKQY